LPERLRSGAVASSTLVPIIIDEGLLLDSLPGVGGSLLYVLETAWSSVTELLRDFAQSPEFAAKMELAFGQDVNVSELQTAWQQEISVSYPD
jgi:hypothetical protein